MATLHATLAPAFHTSVTLNRASATLLLFYSQLCLSLPQRDEESSIKITALHMILNHEKQPV